MVDLAPRPLPGFVVLATFLRAARGLMDEERQRDLERLLVANPEAGAVVAGTGGVRKVRLRPRGRGKRGGLRILYYYRPSVGRIYLISVYQKNVRSDITTSEKKEFHRLTAVLNAETS